MNIIYYEYFGLYILNIMDLFNGYYSYWKFIVNCFFNARLFPFNSLYEKKSGSNIYARENSSASYFIYQEHHSRAT